MDHELARRKLLAWYDQHARDLPWRHGGPYEILVSEFMLQQTRVETVLRHYPKFLARFPTLDALAAATEADVLAAWSGLGYYRRARNLHATAKAIAESDWPDSRDAWRAMPGVGPYMSAALASLVLHEPHLAVDGNVARVLARLTHLSDGPRTPAQLQTRVGAQDAWADPARPHDSTQAWIELGALVCKPVPLCEQCPLSLECKSRANESQLEVPNLRKKAQPKLESKPLAWDFDGERFCVIPGPDSGLLAGLWQLPPARSQQQAIAHISHKFTHKTWKIELFAESCEGTRVSFEDFLQLPHSTAMRKAVEAGLRAAAPQFVQP